MNDRVQQLFATIKPMFEDLHGIAIEGQRRDNSPDMQRVLISQMRMAIAAVDAAADEIKRRLRDAND